MTTVGPLALCLAGGAAVGVVPLAGGKRQRQRGGGGGGIIGPKITISFPCFSALGNKNNEGYEVPAV